MTLEQSEENSRNWGRLFIEGEPLAKDLFNLARDVIKRHEEEPGKRIDLGDIRVISFSLETGETTESRQTGRYAVTSANHAGLFWKEGRIELDWFPEDDKTPYETISIMIEHSRGRRAPYDSFELRKDQTGEVRAFWARQEKLHSPLLDEDLEDDYVEVPLTTTRIKRIGQVLTSASARTWIEKTA